MALPVHCERDVKYTREKIVKLLEDGVFDPSRAADLQMVGILFVVLDLKAPDEMNSLLNIFLFCIQICWDTLESSELSSSNEYSQHTVEFQWLEHLRGP